MVSEGGGKMNLVHWRASPRTDWNCSAVERRSDAGHCGDVRWGVMPDTATKLVGK